MKLQQVEPNLLLDIAHQVHLRIDEQADDSDEGRKAGNDFCRATHAYVARAFFIKYQADRIGAMGDRNQRILNTGNAADFCSSGHGEYRKKP